MLPQQPLPASSKLLPCDILSWMKLISCLMALNRLLFPPPHCPVAFLNPHEPLAGLEFSLPGLIPRPGVTRPSFLQTLGLRTRWGPERPYQPYPPLNSR